MSCAYLEQVPAPDAPEIAFAGRSNAGKSSALNTLCDQKGLARVSNTPGRTQLLNYFVVGELGRPRHGAASQSEAKASVGAGAGAVAGSKYDQTEERPPILGHLVDLPGYGYAKVPGEVKRDWGKLVTDYIEFRENLKGLVVIMDIRHPLTDYDRQLIGWAAEKQIAVHCLLTKCDKLGFGAAKSTLVQLRRDLGPMATAQLFSSTNKTGVDEAREVMLGWLSGPAE